MILPIIMPRHLAVLFAVYASMAVLLLAWQMPPFMNVDEDAHARRADQIAHLGLVAHGADRNVDTGITTASARTRPLIGRQQAKVARGMYVPTPWGQLGPLDAPNTAIYPPLFYLPAAAAIWAGRHLGWTVLPCLTLARVATGLAAMAVGTCAIALAEASALWLFAVLLLPMSLAQMAAISQDGPMIACGALAAALCIRLRNAARHAWPWPLVLLSLCLAAIGMARPPYAAFALLPLACPQAPRPARIGSALFVLIVSVTWWWVAATMAGVDMDHFHASDSGAQMLGLLTAPWRIVTVAWRTLYLHGREYSLGFAGGFLGWMDVALPAFYLKAAWIMLAVAAAVAWFAGSGPRPRWHFVLLGLAATVIGIFLIQYLTWTPVGAESVEGVQGRYFLVPALVAGILLARPIPARSHWVQYCALPIMVFPLISIAITIHWITLRYYF